MLRPDPTLPRQLPAAGPMLLWRDAKSGQREGLALFAHACSNPKCECREIQIGGYLVTDQILGVEDDGAIVRFARSSKGVPEEREVLRAHVDIDTGEARSADRSMPAWALDWLRAELNLELLENLRARVLETKRSAPPPSDWRKSDLSWWKPGLPAAWLDLHPDDDELFVELGRDEYIFADLYCVEPGCTCEEVSVLAMQLLDDEDPRDVGEIALNPSTPSAALFHAHGADRETLQKIWAAFSSKHPVSTLLTQRRQDMRAHAPELHRVRAAQTRAPVNRNEPCPCGSGLKYKKCCLGKTQ